MARQALQLAGIEVTARQAGRFALSGTRTTIDRSAIAHLQASSLGDLLQLIPGQLTRNPTLTDPVQSLLRQVPTTAEAARANALGTSIVLDGAPLSNNANLQTDVVILNRAPGDAPPFASVAGRGVDLRSISPDEVERVEIVQGIPSARHGDLTTGLMNIQTRIGARQPEARLRVNPTLLDLSTSAGWGDGAVRSGWSMTGTITGARDDPRQTLDNFYRGSVLLAWRSPDLLDGRLESALRLRGWRTLDESLRDPDDDRFQRERESRDRGFRVGWTGRWVPREGGETTLRWTASLDASQQTGRFQGRVIRGITPLSPATEDTTRVGVFGPSSYINETTVDGRPTEGYLRVEAESSAETGPIRHLFLVGGEWRHSRNRGAGRQFDPLRPPQQNYNVGERPRDLRDIPALDIVSAYLENRVRIPLGDRRLEARAGLRFDNVAPRTPTRGQFGTELQPRVNAALDLTSSLRARVGWGRAAKAPPLSILYPGPRYFDLVNFNYFAQDPAERLLIVTTRVVEPSNEGASSYTSDKLETALQWARGGVRAEATLYREQTRGAWGWDRELVVFPLDRFGIVETPSGAPPVLTPEPVRQDTLFSAYDVPRPTRDILNRGFEFDLALPEWSRTGTSVSLSGAWTRTTSENRSRSINTQAFYATSSTPPDRVGIYPSDGFEGERISTSLRVIQRLPEVGMVVSGHVQTVWRERRQVIDVATLPTGFVDRTGREVSLSPEAAASPEFEDLRRSVTEGYQALDDPPALWLMNMRLSKSLPSELELAFFVNNVLASRPLHENPRTGGLVQRNPPLFFGVEIVSRFDLF